MLSIADRMKVLIASNTSSSRRFKELEELSGVKAETWRTYWNRNSKPSAEMIEAVAEIWPEYAFWLATGITDCLYGHICPDEVMPVIEPKDGAEKNSKRYFQAQMNEKKNVKYLFEGLGEELAINESMAHYNVFCEGETLKVSENEEILEILERRLAEVGAAKDFFVADFEKRIIK